MANGLTVRSPYGPGSPPEMRSYLSWIFLISALRPASGKLRRLLSFIWGMLDHENLECPRSPAALNSRCTGPWRSPMSGTTKEYRQYFEKDRALVRRFQNIDVNEPTIPDAIIATR